MIKKVLRYCYEAIFPPICCNCKKEGYSLCNDCEIQLICCRPQCLHCNKVNPYWQICSECKDSLPLDFIIAPYQYQGIAGEIIQSLKYKRNTAIISIIKKLMQSSIPEYCKKYTLVPIPLHKKRLRERGFNQAKMIAHSISEISQAPVSELLKRKTHTKKLASQNVNERKTQMKHVFQLSEKPSSKIILVDDIITTGITIKEAAQTIKQLDEKISIGAIVFARTVKEALL